MAYAKRSSHLRRAPYPGMALGAARGIIRMRTPSSRNVGQRAYVSVMLRNVNLGSRSECALHDDVGMTFLGDEGRGG